MAQKRSFKTMIEARPTLAAVGDIIESLGVRQGKETKFIQIVQTCVEQSYSSIKLAREALTDEELSRVFIEKYGERVWSNKDLVTIYHRVEWSQFAGVAETLFAQPLSRLWPILQSASDIQFPQKSVLGALSNTRFRANAGQQQESTRRWSGERGGVTTQVCRAFSSSGSNHSTCISQEFKTLTTTTTAAVPRLPLRVKVPSNLNGDVPFSTTTAIADRRAVYNSPSSSQFLLAAPTPTIAAKQMLQKKFMHERKKMAIERRLAEKAGPETEKMERIRLRLETMGPPPETLSEDLSNRPEKPETIPSDQPEWLLSGGSGQATVRLPAADPSESPGAHVPGRWEWQKTPIPPEVFTLPPSSPPMLEDPSADKTYDPSP